MNYQGRIGLALGSGASRGWSHIGVIRGLAKMGIEPDIVTGSSIGALVGAAYCAGKIDDLEDWLQHLGKLEVARFFELNWSFNGFVDSNHLQKFLNTHVCDEDVNIEDVEKTFAAVSTDLQSGREVWFTEGSMSKAVQASIALPGLFPPLKYDDRWLVDGGLVNPVPVSVCRALGAEFVIAVNLNGNIVGKHLVRNAKDKKDNEEQKQREQQATNDAGLTDKVVQRIKEYSSSLLGDFMEEDSAPGLFDAIAGSINITQDRITRSRMAGDPPDLLLAPKLSHIELLEFHRASDAIAEGEACVERLSSEIKYALQID
ncbi:MAG: patatin-like phospholipase RssA [Gammaproteobacteria bacterium]|jgi:NTE family protein